MGLWVVSFGQMPHDDGAPHGKYRNAVGEDECLRDPKQVTSVVQAVEHHNEPYCQNRGHCPKEPLTRPGVSHFIS
jgi:hypothetical protein